MTRLLSNIGRFVLAVIGGLIISLVVSILWTLFAVIMLAAIIVFSPFYGTISIWRDGDNDAHTD